MTSASATADSIRHAEDLTRRHDENFPVLFRLLPRDSRRHMNVVYAVCRTIDDIGDDSPGTPEDRLRALDAFAADLERCWGGVPEHPVLVALSETVREVGLSPDPLRRLITANRWDQERSRWEGYPDLLDYCRHSATPVGEMVLAVLGISDEHSVALSDETCIGLQLVNFWQDIRRDLDENDRIYLPLRDMEAFGVTEADIAEPTASPAVRELIAFETDRARTHLMAGAPLAARVPRRARLDIRMFTAAGLALCDAIAAEGFDTLARRPAPGRRGRLAIAGRVLTNLVRRGR